MYVFTYDQFTLLEKAIMEADGVSITKYWLMSDLNTALSKAKMTTVCIN